MFSQCRPWMFETWITHLVKTLLVSSPAWFVAIPVKHVRRLLLNLTFPDWPVTCTCICGCDRVYESRSVMYHTGPPLERTDDILVLWPNIRLFTDCIPWKCSQKFIKHTIANDVKTRRNCIIWMNVRCQNVMMLVHTKNRFGSESVWFCHKAKAPFPSQQSADVIDWKQK